MTIREGKNPNDAYNDLSPMARAKMDQFANFMIRMIFIIEENYIDNTNVCLYN